MTVEVGGLVGDPGCGVTITPRLDPEDPVYTG
jgi:hypothetical protein